MIIQFYQGKIPDQDGRYIEDVWFFHNQELENDHMYVQWLFPNKEKSVINPYVPELTDNVINEFRSNQVLLDRVDVSYRLMMSFYNHNRLWLTKNNHNFLRLTRILHTLNLFGMQRQLDQLYSWLIDLYYEKGNDQFIYPITMNYWREAYKGA